jgi:hypothetical protein
MPPLEQQEEGERQEMGSIAGEHTDEVLSGLGFDRVQILASVGTGCPGWKPRAEVFARRCASPGLLERAAIHGPTRLAASAFL